MVRNIGIGVGWFSPIALFLVLAPTFDQERAIPSRIVDLTGQSLYNEAHDAVGSVTEVVIDLESGNITYLVVRLEPQRAFAYPSLAPSGGIYFVVVPWKNVVRLHDNNGYTLIVEKAKVRSAPHLSTVPDTLQAGWDREMRKSWQ